MFAEGVMLIYLQWVTYPCYIFDATRKTNPDSQYVRVDDP